MSKNDLISIIKAGTLFFNKNLLINLVEKSIPRRKIMIIKKGSLSP